jgi:hypothetical protein
MGQRFLMMTNDSPLIGRKAVLAVNFRDLRLAGRSAVIEEDFGDGSYLVFVALDGTTPRAGYRLLVSEYEFLLPVI